MDNKITKSRLSSFFAYEWIKIIIFAVVLVLVFELLFAVTGVKLSSGQQFKVIYDEGVDSNFENNLIEVACLDRNGNPVFSYEVQKIDAEVMSSGKDNVLDIRYEIRDCDVVIAENSVGSDGYTRAKKIFDYFEIWSFEDAVADGKAYLRQFLKDGITSEDAQLDYNNLDEQKIKEHFIQTHKKDNRFRTQKSIDSGVELEKQRIKNVCADVSDVEYLLEAHPEIFLKYHKYEQVLTTISEGTSEHAEYLAKYNAQTVKSHAIFTDKLTKGKHKVADYFTSGGETKDVVLFAFDFSNEMPDLQFESLRFMTSTVRNFSDFLDNR